MQAENELLLTDNPVQEDKETELMSVAILGVSLVMGLIGNAVFFHYRLGINIPIYTVIFVLAEAALLTTFQRKLAWKNTLFVIPVVLFAGLLSLYTAPPLVLLNIGLLAGTGFLLTRYATTPQFIGGHWISALLAAVEFGFIGWAEGPLTVLQSSAQLVGRFSPTQEHAQRLGAVVRGLILTLPIILVFGLLLASADAIFGDLLEGALSWMLPDNIDSLIAQIFLIGFLTWGSLMLLKMLLMGQFAEIPLPEKPKTGIFRLTMIEAGMILGSVDLLFLLFVMIQAKYLFGGEVNITVQGYTYAEYARRGFFELLAVSAMTMALVVILDTFTFRFPAQEMWFRGLSIGLIALTVVMLVAAFMRLNLYEDAYGFTRLRVMVKVFMVWLAVLFIILVVDLLYRNKQVFWVGVMAVAVGFVLTLNLMNMDAFIASRNIDHFEKTGKLDIDYLTSLSDDAIPAITPLLEKKDELGPQYELLLAQLGPRLYFLDVDRKERGWLGYHFSKDRAWEALDRYRDVLLPHLRPTYTLDAF